MIVVCYLLRIILQQLMNDKVFDLSLYLLSLIDILRLVRTEEDGRDRTRVKIIMKMAICIVIPFLIIFLIN